MRRPLAATTMLEALHLHDVGPARDMSATFAPRLNVITGDNGLGKTFLLEVAWWALTGTWPRTWPGHGALPDPSPSSTPTIRWSMRQGDATCEVGSEYEFRQQRWKASPIAGAALDPALVVYARVDGGTSVFDPRRRGEMSGRPGTVGWGPSNVFQFDATEVFEGLTLEGVGGEPVRRVCEGLWRDLSLWSLDPNDDGFELLARVVEALTPHEPVRLTRRRLRVVADDTRESPVLDTAAGPVMLVHASAALRRILALAYTMVWAWREHRAASLAQRVPAATELVLLVDEVEAHLHPRWQRVILPSLLDVASTLAPGLRCQVIVTTHAPLVLASLEPRFDASRDGWFDLDLEGSPAAPVLRRRPFVRRGDASSWLTSAAFDLASARSLEGERALDVARGLLRAEPPPAWDEVERADEALRRTLGELDPFWVRWSAWVDARREAS